MGICAVSGIKTESVSYTHLDVYKRQLITNNAAAALAFPLALSLSNQLGVSPMPFFVVICIAASAK